ncbi:MAG: hypothetical protein CMP12_12780 [Zunongwangia sp.]|nr:hypothetical protein [Zunongwangia sp.]
MRVFGLGYFLLKKKEKKKIKYERIFGYYNKSLVQEYKELQKLNYVFTFYLTTPLSSGFSKLYSYDKSVEDYKFNNNIGAGGKLTKFFKGFINFKNRKNFRENYEIKDYLEVSNDSMFSEVYEMKAIRDSILNKKIPKKIDSYLVGDYQYDKKLVEITAKDIKEKKQNLLYSKYLEFYKEIAEAEIDYAKDKKLITGSRYGWLSFEYYFAITQTQLTTSIDSVNTTKHDFRAWRASVSYNYLWNFVTDTFWKDFSIKPSFLVSYFNTNNFIASGNTTNIFQPILRVSESQQVLGTSEAVYLGDFNTFKAFAFKGGLSSLFFNNTIGLSASYELTTGEITNQNWKLGIPISLKDKKNKPTVNFEIQWREINKEHMLGISVGYNFGKFVQ